VVIKFLVFQCSVTFTTEPIEQISVMRIVKQKLKRLSEFYSSRRCIAVYSTARHQIIQWAN
jgi:virulence-associated protein VapD